MREGEWNKKEHTDKASCQSSSDGSKTLCNLDQEDIQGNALMLLKSLR